MHTLLCISHPSDASATIQFAELFISRLNSDASLLTVRPPGESPKTGEKLLARASKSIKVPLKNRQLRHGSSAEEILAEASSQAYNLVILGANEHITLGEFFLGSIARLVAANVDTSILIVRQHANQLKRILVATAGHEFSERTVLAGDRIAQAAQAKLTLLYVAHALPSMYTGLARLEETLTELLQTDTPVARHLKDCAELFRSLGVDAHIELRHGLPSEEVPYAAETGKFDLLVVGGSGPNRLNRLFMTEIAGQIAERATCPLLVIKNDLGLEDPGKNSRT